MRKSERERGEWERVKGEKRMEEILRGLERNDAMMLSRMRGKLMVKERRKKFFQEEREG